MGKAHRRRARIARRKVIRQRDAVFSAMQGPQQGIDWASGDGYSTVTIFPGDTWKAASYDEQVERSRGHWDQMRRQNDTYRQKLKTHGAR